MNLYIATLEALEKEATTIQEFLDLEYSEDASEVQARGVILTGHMSRTGKMLADAKLHKDRAVKESILSRLDTGLSPTTLNKLIDATCEKENYLVNWIERLNRSCTHQLDFARTLISKAKAEMNLGGFQ